MRENRQMFADLFQKYLAITPDSHAMALKNWRGKKFGNYLFQAENKLLAEECADLAGYRMMHLGLIGDQCSLESFNQLHQFYIRPHTNDLSFDGSLVVAANEDLPIPSDVVDIERQHVPTFIVRNLLRNSKGAGAGRTYDSLRV